MPPKNRFAEMQPEIAAWRRDFHENPEILFETHRTSALVAPGTESDFFDADLLISQVLAS